MILVSTKVHISAPQQRVFEVFTDLLSAPANITSIDKLDVLTDGPIGKGTRFAETRTMCGRPRTETLQITAWMPPQSYSVDLESGGTRFTTRFTFKADAASGHGGETTTVEVMLTATHLRFTARLMTIILVLMKGSFRKMFEKDLADLKAVAEGHMSGLDTAAG